MFLGFLLFVLVAVIIGLVINYCFASSFCLVCKTNDSNNHNVWDTIVTPELPNGKKLDDIFNEDDDDDDNSSD